MVFEKSRFFRVKYLKEKEEMIRMELGVHDVMTLNDGQSTDDKYRSTIEFAKEIEKLNYKRYWVSEHHGISAAASSSPELLVAYLAAVTDKMRLGTGGTMLLNYSPLKVAEDFKTLTLLAPGRIDLGLGRAPGGGRNEIIALSEGRQVDFDNLYEKAEIILKYLVDEKPESFYGNTFAIPEYTKTVAEPWMLGSSGQSAIKTAEMGLGYSFAKFFGIESSPEIFQYYRDRFQPSQFFDKPKTMVSYQIVVADTEEEADYHAKPIERSTAQHYTAPIVNPESIKDLEFSSRVQNNVDRQHEKRFMIKGSAEQVEAILAEEIETIGIDELMVYSPIYDEKARLRSYELLAKMFNKI